MNDFTVGTLARGHQDDLQREADHAAPVAEARRARASSSGQSALSLSTSRPNPVEHRWRQLLAHLVPAGIAGHGHGL